MAGNFFMWSICVCAIFFQLVHARSMYRKATGGLPDDEPPKIREANGEAPGDDTVPAEGGVDTPPQGHKTIDQLIMEANKQRPGVADQSSDNQNDDQTLKRRETDETSQDSDKEDEEHVVELDMNVTDEQYEHLYCQGSECKSKSKSKRKRSTSDVTTRWPDGVIPYEINHRDFSYEEVQELKAALAEWENHTCLQFRPASGADKNKVKYQNGAGCNSMVGMIGGTQLVNLQAPGCRTKGLYLHETGHSIGLLHEHQLPQRDKYVRIDYGVVAPNLRDSFKKYSPDAVALVKGVEYDFASIMHYGKTAFSYDGMHQTIYPLDKKKEKYLGFVSEKKLSFYDIKAVNVMYNCSKNCDPVPTCQGHCFVNKQCKCFCPEDMPKVICENKDTDEECENFASRGDCNKNTDYMELKCRKTCGTCVEEDENENAKEVCINKHGDDECEEWAGRGECDSNKEFMHKSCRKACSLCVSASRPKPTTTAAPEPCVNAEGDSQCEDWAERGECTSNPTYMTKSCRKACGKCTSTSGCSDKDAKCGTWKKFCGTNEHVTNNCLKTCGAC